ncbi:MAG TPA: PorV/PorQ family protein [Elusimicrobiota bacterium]|nr:PorV/PorQ family protein [Elusimicrobiota bacterium]
MRRAAPLAVLLALAPAGASAASASNGAAVLRLPLSARAAALGGGTSALAAGLDSFGVNPAGVAGGDGPELLTSYFTGAADDSFGFFGYARPTKAGTPMAGFAYYDAGNLPVVNLDGTTQNVTAERDYVASLGWALPLGGGVSVGAIGKGYKLTLAQSASAAGFAADFGARWATPVKGLSLGAALLNVGPDVKFEQSGDPLPRAARGGAAWTFVNSTPSDFATEYSGIAVTFAADAVSVRDEGVTAEAGAEAAVSIGKSAVVSLRLGNQFNSASDGGLSFGVGVREGRFSGDYALTSRGALGNVQDFSIGVRF